MLAVACSSDTFDKFRPALPVDKSQGRGVIMADINLALRIRHSRLMALLFLGGIANIAEIMLHRLPTATFAGQVNSVLLATRAKKEGKLCINISLLQGSLKASQSPPFITDRKESLRTSGQFSHLGLLWSPHARTDISPILVAYVQARIKHL